jgi:hypothetical protein
MQQLAVKMTSEEICALLELVQDQLFRVKFIDPKFPGHKANPAKVALANSAIDSLRATYNKAMKISSPTEAPIRPRFHVATEPVAL